MKWIDINDRVPEDRQLVIIDLDGDFLPLVARFCIDHDKEFIIPFRSDIAIEEVKRWMPLPKLVKVEP